MPGQKSTYTRVRKSEATSRYHDVPDKNEYSHPHDALQYVATQVFGGVVRGREEGQQGLKLPPLKYQWERTSRFAYEAQ